MKPSVATLLRNTVMAAALLALSAPAANQVNPYQQVPRRNVFNLQPIPTAPPVVDPPPFRPVPPKIFITGLVEIGGVAKALVEISEPGRPVQRPILAAGGRFDALEILEVDVPGDRVRVRFDGTEGMLTIQKPKPGVPLPPSPPPVPGPPRLALPVRG